RVLPRRARSRRLPRAAVDQRRQLHLHPAHTAVERAGHSGRDRDLRRRVSSPADSPMNAKLACCVFVVSSTLVATARVEAACTISATGVSFGTYDVFTSGADASTGTITYRCSASVTNVQITISTGASPTYTPRTLVKGSEN